MSAKPPDSASRLPVAIIGAGWAGLACAITLIRAGIPVTLFEAGRQVGGRARSIKLDTRRLDNGQHLLLGAYTHTLQLMRQIGLQPEQQLTRLPMDLQAAVPCAGRANFRLQLPDCRPPFNLAWGLLRAKGVNLTERWQLLRWMLKLQGQRFLLPAAEQSLTVMAWLRLHRQSDYLCQQLWAPLCLAALNTPAERASAQIFANVLRDSLGSFQQGATDFLLPKVDLGAVFADPAADYLAAQGATIERHQRIKTFFTDSSKHWYLQAQSADAAPVAFGPFSQLVIATAPQHALPLLRTLPITSPEIASCITQLSTLTYEPIATVYLDYVPPLALPVAPLHLNLGIGQWLVNRGGLGESAGTAGLVSAVQSGQGEWSALDDATLCARLHEAIAQTQAEPIHPPRWQRVIREQRATFSCQPLLPRPGCQPAPESWPTLYLAGDYTWADYPATLEGAIRSGIRAGETIVQRVAVKQN